MKRKDYLRLLKILRAEAKRLGVEVKLYRRPIKYPNYFGVRAGYSGAYKKIIVTAYGNQTYSYIVAVLAHEIRHAQHDNLGLYKEYYQKELYDTEKFAVLVLQNKKKLPSAKVAMAAEDDCNLFARNFMKSHGFPLKRKTYKDFYEPYPYHDTLAFYAKFIYEEKKKELKNKVK